MRNLPLLAAIVVLWLLSTGQFTSARRDVERLAIRGPRIVTVTGETIEAGTILVEAGRIAALGRQVAVPPDTPVMDATGLTAMPGIIDAEGIAKGHQIAGVTGTMRAELVAGDFFDPYGSDYRPERELRDFVEWGVTAVNVKLTDRNVFDGTTSVVRLHAPRSYQDHFVKYRAALRLNLGEMARSEGEQFPTTRMGIVALVRQQFVKAQEYMARRDGPDQRNLGSDAGPQAKDLKLEPLVAALKREVPVIVRAVEPRDVEAALRIADEFSLRLVLSGSTQMLEGQVESLVARRVPVVLGDYYAHINNHIGDQTEFRYETAALLSGRGVTVAFGGIAGETKLLSVNAGIAVQHGMDRAEAIKGLTINPARILGVDDRVGSLEVGKDADIVLYRGDPLEIASPVEKVFVAGRLVYQRQPFDPAYHTFAKPGRQGR